MQYHEVNITIDLGQEFHIAYVWVQMANSPRPAAWVLERSTDFGQTYRPWQYFAATAKDCARVRSQGQGAYLSLSDRCSTRPPTW